MNKRVFLPFLLCCFLTACIHDDFDKPEPYMPEVDFPANMTIAQLKTLYQGSLIKLPDSIIIKGIVVANDESGNFYKTLVIQDETGGIEVKINKTSLYTMFRVGQRIFIKCKDLYLGTYGGLIQLGYIYNNGIGQIPEVMINDHIFKDSFPGNPPQPIVLDIPSLSSTYLSMLIQIDSVSFTTPGLPFAEPTTTTNRTIKDKNGQTLIVRTSNYANFASTPIPEGTGSIRGILSIYNGTYQLYLRDLNDLVNWSNPNPPQNYLLNEQFYTTPTNWIIYNVSGNKDWYYNSAYNCMTINGSGSDTACQDYLISPAITIPSGTQPILKFMSWTRYVDNFTTKPFTVLITTNYTGNPLTTTWTELQVTLPAQDSQTWTSSGDINLSSFAGNTVRIAFKYMSKSGNSGEFSAWQVDDVKIVLP
ncbi:MAG: DUF5689 domain-containing protein [Bacteroidales bacterium]|nr:DUF5689 domain-containing protein [Bacteroidales bacterium]